MRPLVRGIPRDAFKNSVFCSDYGRAVTGQRYYVGI